MRWPEFCSQLLSRFARDEHKLLLRRLFQIRQTGPVSEYIDQFVALVDKLKAYAKHPDPLYYTQHFINGLRDEIKAVVLVQRPSTLDTVCILAQLQEEAMGVIKRPYRIGVWMLCQDRSRPGRRHFLFHLLHRSLQLLMPLG